MAEESCEKSLEPAAYLIIQEEGYFTRTKANPEGNRQVSLMHPENDPAKTDWNRMEPLVRLSDVVSLLEKAEREAEAYTTAEEDPVTAFKHGSLFVLSNIRERLEEFTQLSEAE